MNIKDISSIGSTKSVDPSRKNADNASQPAAKEPDDRSASGRSDQLSLTSIGKYLSTAAGESAPVNRERVDAIRESLANGSYEIDSRRVAEKLISLESGLS